MEKDKQEKNWCENLKEKAEEQIKKIAEEGINTDNITYLGKIVDIHKDLANEDYWKEKVSMYRDGNYDRNYYGRRGMKGTGPYSRYGTTDMNYRNYGGGRGSGRYRGEDIMDEMFEHYGNYSDGKEEYNNYGNYNAKEDSKISLKRMLQSCEDFFNVIMNEADSPEEIQMVKETARKISEI